MVRRVVRQPGETGTLYALAHNFDLYGMAHMTIGTALVLIFCTPLGWIGLLCLAVAVVALRG